jgi:hypothetical protein
MKNLIRTLILLMSIGIISCKNNNEDTAVVDASYSTEIISESTNEPTSSTSLSTYSNSNSTYHTDSRYKYESRTGTSGNYQYNYDVEGSDDNGNNITGNVDMRGKYGSGTITDDDGEEKDVDVEWTGKGTMEATDDDGNSYELEAE